MSWNVSKILIVPIKVTRIAFFIKRLIGLYSVVDPTDSSHDSYTLVVKILKTKWKNLRDNYQRRRREFLQSKKSGAGTSDIRQPKWPWYQQLAFLDTVLPDAP